MSSLCAAEVTNKIEDFINGIPGQVKSSFEVLQAEANQTVSFLKYIDNNLRAIAGNVTANLAPLLNVTDIPDPSTYSRTAFLKIQPMLLHHVLNNPLGAPSERQHTLLSMWNAAFWGNAFPTSTDVFGNSCLCFLCLSAEKAVDVGPYVDRLIQVIKQSKLADPSCVNATEYPGVQIPTQCVVSIGHLIPREG